MFYHLYTEQDGQLVKVAECQPFLNKSNAELEATTLDNPVILTSVYCDMPDRLNVRKEIDHAIYDTANTDSDALVLWIIPASSGFIAVPWMKPFKDEIVAGYSRNDKNSRDWQLLARSMAGKAAGVPMEVKLF